RGFADYASAQREHDADRHAQLVVAGSIEMGAIEQERLQPFVVRVLCAPVTVAFMPCREWLDRSWLARWPALVRIGHRATEGVDRGWDRWMTRDFMIVQIPGQKLRLGHDAVPVP